MIPSAALMATCVQPIAILVLVLVAVKIFGSQYGFWSRRAKKRYHPIAGTVFQKFLNFGRLQDFITDISHKHKTFRLYSPFRNMIYTTDPTIVEHILRTNFKNYGKGQYNYENLKELFGVGIFAVDGDEWRHQRKLASYEFFAKASKNYSGGIFRANAAKLAYLILEKARSDVPMDIQMSCGSDGIIALIKRDCRSSRDACAIY